MVGVVLHDMGTTPATFPCVDAAIAAVAG